MPVAISPVEACKLDLYSSDKELREKYPIALAERIGRLREVYNYWLANPEIKDKVLTDWIIDRFHVSRSSAYSDLAVVRQLVPLLSQKSRDFHRARYNEMILEVYAQAKEKGDLRTMERAATSYANNNRVSEDDIAELPYNDIVIQPFCATTDVSALGLKPIPDLYNYIDKLTKDLSRDFADIQDVEFEEADLEEQFLFPANNGAAADKSES